MNLSCNLYCRFLGGKHKFKVYFLSVILGKGLTLVTSVLEGSWQDKYAAAQAAKQVRGEYNTEGSLVSL